MLITKLLLLALTSGWSTQVGVSVKVEGDQKFYSDKQAEDVPIPLPTTRYTCTRRPVMTRGDVTIVLVSCTEGPREGFVVGVSCASNEAAEHQSTVTINISNGPKPLTATFIVACRTLPAGTWT
jgi:hypothetical protein